MTRTALHTLALALLVAGSLGVFAGAQESRPRTEAARVYCVDPDYWKGGAETETCVFPERSGLGDRANVGVAFSGGGTRSAAATLGALRGLARNGWLSRIGYVSAVSGGGWTALPYTYAARSDVDVLGETAPCDVEFEPGAEHDSSAAYVRCGTPGLIGQAIANSNLLRCALESMAGDRFLPAELRPVAGFLGAKCAAPRESSETFASILGRIFIDPTLCKGCGRLTIGRNAHPNPTRPFLILGGTIVQRNPNWRDPKLLPFELTPMYAGVRQRLGHLGGAYVETWAYGRRPYALDGQSAILPATLGDSISLEAALAITGSAPYLATLLNRPVGPFGGEILGQLSRFFPLVGHWSVRDRRMTPFDRAMPHGDGGFTEYQGIMPLLARDVRNILVVLNANGPIEASNDLRALFEPVVGMGLDGDKSNNVVFERARYKDIVEKLNEARTTGPTVACLRNLTVVPNEFYNIRGSVQSTNVCWIYNDQTPHWLRTQSMRVQNFVKPRKEFERFPWYRTFGERLPEVIDLTMSQVMLLAARTEWNFIDADAGKAIADAMGWSVRADAPSHR